MKTQVPPPRKVAHQEYTWSDKRRPRTFGSLYKYRQVLLFTVWKDLRIRYKQTVLGVAWVILQPLATMLVFYHVIFGSRRLGFPMKSGSQGVPLYLGLVVWGFALAVIANGSTALLYNHSIITKVYFPREIPVLSVTLAGLVDLAAALLLFPPMAILTHTPINWAGFGVGLLLIVPLAIILHSLAVLLAALIVVFRDVKILVQFLLTGLFFLSAVFIPATFYVARFQSIVLANPIAIVIDTFRHLSVGTPSSIGRAQLIPATIVTAIVIVSSRVAFRLAQRRITDVL